MSGKGVGGVLSLIYLAVAVRTLGVAAFGAFALVLAYAQAIANLVQFQSWQAVIRFGAVHLSSRREDRLGRLLTFTSGLDLVSAAVGAVAAATGVFVVGPLLGWSSSDRSQTALFGAVLLLVSLRATPTGILRLFDRFALATAAETLLPAMRLAGAIVAWQADTGVEGFLLAWAVAEAAASIGLWLAAIRVLKHEAPGAMPGCPSALSGVRVENPGLWRFTWATNASTTINLVWQQVGTLAVGAVLGAAAAGGYRLASQIAQALSKPAASLARAIYPELARLAAGQEASSRALVRHMSFAASVGGGAIVAAAMLIGEPVLVLIGGEPFRSAQSYLVLLVVATAIELAGFALEPALLAGGMAGRALLARAAAAAIYLSALYPFIALAGAHGAAFAAILGSLLSVAFLGAASRRSAELVRTLTMENFK